MKHGKLDRRYAGSQDFKYYVNFNKLVEGNSFIEVRNWCWEQWGPSCELDLWYRVGQNGNPAWCWMSDDWKTRICFRSDKEYSWFILKWIQ